MSGDTAQDNGTNKVGFSKYGVHSRYNPDAVNGTGWESGPGGIDASKADMNWELPIEMASTYEKLRQGNKYVDDARVMRDDGSPEAVRQRAILGSGASEYTHQDQTPLYNQDVGKGVEGTVGGISAQDFFAHDESRRISSWC